MERAVVRFWMPKPPARYNPPLTALSSLQIQPVSEIMAMRCGVTLKNHPLFTISPFYCPSDLAINGTTSRTGMKWRRMHILLVGIAATSRTMRPARRTVLHSAPVKTIFRRIESAHLLMLNLIATHPAFLHLCSPGILSE